MKNRGLSLVIYLLGLSVRVSVPSEGGSLPGSIVLGVDHDSMEWSPGDTSELNIVEPLGANVLQVFDISDGRVSLGFLRSSDSSSQVDNLVSNLGIDIFSTGLVEESVEQARSSSEDFSLVQLKKLEIFRDRLKGCLRSRSTRKGHSECGRASVVHELHYRRGSFRTNRCRSKDGRSSSGW